MGTVYESNSSQNSTSNISTKNSDDEGDGYNKTALITCLVLLFILVGLGILGFIIYKKRKAKKLRESVYNPAPETSMTQNMTQNMTAFGLNNDSQVIEDSPPHSFSPEPNYLARKR